MKRQDINPYVPAKVAASLKKHATASACCKVPANLLPEAADDVNITAMLRCRVCHRGHRYMLAETGHFGLTFGQVEPTIGRTKLFDFGSCEIVVG